MIISLFCLAGNQLLWECGIIPNSIYEHLSDIFATIAAWLVIIFIAISGIMLIIIMWTRM